MQKEMRFKSAKNKKTALEAQELRNQIIIMRCTKTEKEQIKQKAQKCNLRISHYVRQCALDYKPKSMVITKEHLELKNYAADLGRLGGLLKLMLTKPEQAAVVGISDIKHLLTQILVCQQLLQQAALKLI